MTNTTIFSGIFIRYGHFYNLVNNQWEKYNLHPYDPLVTFPNAMFSFRGKPTVFGNPR